MTFRCGYCLKEKDEENPRSFRMTWVSPTGRLPCASFYICRECAEEHLKPVQLPLFDTRTISGAPPGQRTFFFSRETNEKDPQEPDDGAVGG